MALAVDFAGYRMADGRTAFGATYYELASSSATYAKDVSDIASGNND